MELWKSFPKEGTVYEVENFIVESNSDQFQLAAHKYKLQFHLSTVFRETNRTIAAMGYHFVPIKSIVQKTANNIELIGDFNIIFHFIGSFEDYAFNFCIFFYAL